MRRYIKELVPTRFEDIVAMISLYRPGPMEWIPGYIKAKHHPESIRYLHASFESILKETNGVAIYQEQILQIARNFSGFSLGEADILRKAVGKKNPVLLKEQKEKFIEGAVKNSHQKKFAEEVFEKVIEPFAGYGFNKAHAACYAMISYRTAYLKAHYAIEFMAALISSDHGDADRVAMEIMECEEAGILVLPPSVNESFSDFTVVDKTTIRFGLSAIKGLGDGSVEEILKARKSGKFKSLEDLLQRVPLKIINKKTLESLALSGAFDEFADRKAIAESVDDITQYAKSIQKIGAEGQTDIFGAMDQDAPVSDIKLKKVQPATLMERLNNEKEYLGLYVSGHPLRGLKKYLAKKVYLIESLTRRQVGKTVKLGGLLSKIKKVFTKAGAHMLYCELEDPTGRIEVIVFPKVYSQYASFFVEGQILVMEGRLDIRSGNLQFSCNNAKSVSLESMIKNAKDANLYDEKEKMSRKVKVFDPIEETKTDENMEEAVSYFEPENESVTGGGEETGGGAKDDGGAEKSYIIEVAPNTPMEKLTSLKELLLKNPGERRVEILLGGKQIRLPFGITVTPDMEAKIKDLVK